VNLLTNLQNLVANPVLANEPLAHHTTYGVGGPVQFFVNPANREELRQLLEFCKKTNLQYFIIGHGTNLLVSDQGYAGLIISLAKSFKSLEISDRKIDAETGLSLRRLVRESIRNNLTGLEGLAGVPGTIGGAIRMNAGAFGAEISNFLVEVEVIDQTGAIISLSAAEIDFSYRRSSITNGQIITWASFELAYGEPDQIKNLRDLANNKRIANQPIDKRSAGSVFKNPRTDLAAGYMIDQCGLKGSKSGGAEISTKHANFIVNNGNATASDIIVLINLAYHKVKRQFGIELELEIKTLGFAERIIS